MQLRLVMKTEPKQPAEHTQHVVDLVQIIVHLLNLISLCLHLDRHLTADLKPNEQLVRLPTSLQTNVADEQSVKHVPLACLPPHRLLVAEQQCFHPAACARGSSAHPLSPDPDHPVLDSLQHHTRHQVSTRSLRRREGATLSVQTSVPHQLIPIVVILQPLEVASNSFEIVLVLLQLLHDRTDHTVSSGRKQSLVINTTYVTKFRLFIRPKRAKLHSHHFDDGVAVFALLLYFIDFLRTCS